MRRSHGGGGGRRRAGAQTGAGEGEIEEGGIGPDGLMVVVMVMMGGRKSPGTGRGGERSRISSTRGGVIVGSIIISSSSSSSSSSMGMVGSRRNRRSRRWCCGGGREKNGVEIGLGFAAAQRARRVVVGARRVFGGVEGAQPHPRLLPRVADLGGEAPPRPLAHAAIVRLLGGSASGRRLRSE